MFGKIENGKIVFIDKINIAHKTSTGYVIEFNNNIELIDNGIITKEIYDKIKNEDAVYSLKIKDYAKLKDITPKEHYNIDKALELKYISEDDKYTKFLSVTCGFNNVNDLLRYSEAVFKLLEKDK